MSKVKDGDTVKVHYTGTLKNGEVFDTSEDREPLEFTLGQGQLIPGFEKAVTKLNVGDSTTVDIPSKEAYGDVRDDLIISVPKDQLPDNIEPQIGMQLQVNQPDGQPVPVRVTEIGDENLTLDANHPLAGKDLTFKIELVEVAN
ncbi:MAG: peptidylprolyl isomerase [Balneolaceae bacterium]|nr:peptidylprolyl isomerase [Balneolaceae bacterium]